MRRFFLLLCCLLLNVPPVWAQVAWYGTRQRYRRIVETSPPSDRGNLGLCAVSFYHFGTMKPDGSDILVLDGPRKLPFRILQMGPGDRVRLVFRMSPRARRYVITWGDANAQRDPATELKGGPGLLLTIYTFRFGNLTRLVEVQKAVRNATGVMGRDYVSRVFLGHNPFGPTDTHYVAHFHGRINIPRPGRYEFYTSSDGSSFLLIDGRVAVQKPALGRAPRDARIRGAVQLTKGWHDFDYYHGQVGGPAICVAAWKPPGTGRPQVIPPSAFPQVRQVEAKPWETRGGGYKPDFVPKVAGEAILEDENRMLIKMLFKNIGLRGPASGYTYRWEFGDGQTAEGTSPQHIYLVAGDYRVKCTARKAGLKYETEGVVHVERDWNRQTDRKWDQLADYVKPLLEYKVEALDSGSLTRLVEVLEHVGRYVECGRAAKVLVQRTDLDEVSLRATCLLAGKVFLNQLNEADNALAVYTTGAGRLKNPVFRAEMLVRAGGIRLRELRRAVPANEAFEGALQLARKVRHRDTERTALMGLADVYRRLGQAEKAAEYLDQAARIQVKRGDHTRQVVQEGSYARAAEEYLRKKVLDEVRRYLDRWQWEYPRCKMVGYWSLLSCRYWAQKEKYQRVVDEANDLVSVNEESMYCPELLLLAGRAQLKLNKRRDALETFRRIQKDFPGAPLSAMEEAAKAVHDLTGPKRGSR